jgi:TonB family protein
MKPFLNYLTEANLALLCGYVFYKLVLQKETSFSFQRIFLLTVIVLSLLLPFVKFNIDNQAGVIPSVGGMLPANWLPEISISTLQETNVPAEVTVWQFLTLIYALGVIVSIAGLVVPLVKLALLISRHPSKSYGKVKIIESAPSSPFSFFNYIVIPGNPKSADDQQRIIRHEVVHARRGHSYDIMLIHVVRILFWFNPVINAFKKTFVQLHEFEADARSVRSDDVDNYCNLLARIALENSGLSIANHFNNSLTIKRIEMMRTLKRNIKKWKIAASLATLAVVFVVVACQDQVIDEVNKSTLSQASQPPEVTSDMAKFSQQFPEVKLKYIEGDMTDLKKLIASQYTKEMVLKTYTFEDNKGGAIIRETELLANAKSDDGVYTVVDEQPEYPGGYEKMIEYIQGNLRYPQDAARKKIEGVVYVQFVVDETGKILDPGAIRGVEESIDAEAVRVVAAMPNWIPAKEEGKLVKVRFVLPIRFKTGIGEKAQ